jgi:hypothetical protein
MALSKRFLQVRALLIAVLMAALIAGIAYFTARENFTFFIGQYILLFGLFYALWLNRQEWKFIHFLILAIILRLILLFAAPELSNDFYRFLWDGELLSNGINPFQYTPNDALHKYISVNGVPKEIYSDHYLRILYHGMGELSQEHYSCYPVLNQFFFVIAAFISDNIMVNTIVLKVFVVLADIGVIFMGRKIAKHFGLSPHVIWLYALNPIILIEFTGNLHFEGVMIFFFLVALYAVLKNQWGIGAVFLGLAIQIKLIPLMFIPFFFKKLKWRRAIGFAALTGFTVLAVGGILLNELYFSNMMESINEYFVRFQFNSGLYNFLVNFALEDMGDSRFYVVGSILSSLAGIGVLILALLKSYRSDLDVVVGILFALLIYYGLATTVHPWYVSFLLILSVFTNYKFPLVWSLLVMLSYSAYGAEGVVQNPILLTAEYVLLYSIALFEIRRNWKSNAVGIQLKTFFTDQK